MSNKFWDKHSIKGKESAHNDTVYGAHSAAAHTSTPVDVPDSDDKSTGPSKGSKINYGGGHNNDMSHPGFAAVQSKIASKEGVSKEAAGAILANASRHASGAAKKANPNLKKVKG